MDKYIFILGKNPGLSLAEIITVCNTDKFQFLGQAAVFELTEVQVQGLMSKLGGTVKIAKVLETTNSKDLLPTLQELVYQAARQRNLSSKFNFGFSTFGPTNLNYKNLGIKTKQYLKDRGLSARWVNLLGKNMDSATAYHNSLHTDKGVEVLVMAVDNKTYLLGRTIELQPFVEFSRRDYGRPSRDSHSGMLPPKLARLMLNLAKFSPDKVALDPFCGSGTVLNEAILMGAKKVLGSDISDKAIIDTKLNLDWLKKTYNKDVSQIQAKVADVKQISRVYNQADLVATEPYLGPQRGKIEINQVKQELEELYFQALVELSKLLRPGSRLVMAWPVFNPEQQAVYLKVNLGSFEIVRFSSLDSLDLTSSRGTVIYGRPGQRLWREIMILEKK